MKKLLLIFYVLVGLVIASPININKVKDYDRVTNLSSGHTKDEKIIINVSRTSTGIEIEHNTDFKITGVVVEIVIIENGQNVSTLETYEVTDNKTSIASNIVALKVHQVLVFKYNVQYRYSTTGQTSAPSNFNWASVIRKGLTEIETTKVQVVDSDRSYDMFGKHKYFEFYFEFKEPHDKVHSIDVDYKIRKRNVLGKPGEWLDVRDSNLAAANKWELKQWGWDSLDGKNNPHKYPSSFVNVLEENKTTNRGTHVARIAPTAHNYEFDLDSDAIIRTKDYQIENWAIIRIEYELNGEHILDDVLNAPVTPDKPDDGLLDWFYKFYDDVKGIISTVKNFLTKNFVTIGIVIVIIIAMIIGFPLYLALKSLWNIIKLLFKGIKQILLLPKKLFNFLKFLFVPPKNKK